MKGQGLEKSEERNKYRINVEKCGYMLVTSICNVPWYSGSVGISKITSLVKMLIILT